MPVCLTPPVPARYAYGGQIIPDAGFYNILDIRSFQYIKNFLQLLAAGRK
jgi:hypothetical protein